MNQADAKGPQQRAARGEWRQRAGGKGVLAMEFGGCTIVCTAIFMRTLMDVRMAMRPTVMSVRMRMYDERFRSGRPSSEEARRDSAYQHPHTVEAQHDQHERDREFHRESEPDRHGKFKDDDGGANRKHGQRMPEAPDHADTRGRGETALAAQNGGDRDYVIGVGRMAHPEQQSEQCDSKRCGTSGVHRQLTFPSERQQDSITDRSRGVP